LATLSLFSKRIASVALIIIALALSLAQVAQAQSPTQDELDARATLSAAQAQRFAQATRQAESARAEVLRFEQELAATNIQLAQAQLAATQAADERQARATSAAFDTFAIATRQAVEVYSKRTMQGEEWGRRWLFLAGCVIGVCLVAVFVISFFEWRLISMCAWR